MPTLLLSKKEVARLLTMDLALASARTAFSIYQKGRMQQPPIVSMAVDAHQGELDLKSCYVPDSELISIKIASGYWNNPKDHRLPAMHAPLVLLAGKTGYPLCIMDGSLITGYRTGAAGALSAALLARKESRTVALVGSGNQAFMQVMALKKVLDIQEVRVYSPDRHRVEAFKKNLHDHLDISVIPCKGAEEALKGADILITATPSEKAVVSREWIKAGTHIIAIGADMAGKQELDTSILKAAKIYVDSLSQCLERGRSETAFLRGWCRPPTSRGNSATCCSEISRDGGQGKKSPFSTPREWPFRTTPSPAVSTIWPGTRGSAPASTSSEPSSKKAASSQPEGCLRCRFWVHWC
jgi:ornithine cyclodeaminase/alanine dehydrogenase-like protein (mu-crystallin family)